MAKEITSANGFYEQGKYFYGYAQKLEDNQESLVRINSNYHIAAFNIWIAFSLGHLQAPYSLSVFLNQGVGAKKNDYVAKLLFGVALELKDEKCQLETNKQNIPASMNKAVQDLTKLVRETNAKIPSDKEIEMEQVNSQMGVFDDFIILPDNHTMMGLLKRDRTWEDTEYNVSIAGAHQSHDDGGSCCMIL